MILQNPLKIYLLYIAITKNNFKLSIMEPVQKHMLYWTNLGVCGYRNDQCNSSMVTKEMSEKVGNKLKELRLKCVGIYLRGVTRWKGIFIKGLFKVIKKALINVAFIRDLTPIPFNGCSPQVKARKRRKKKKKFRGNRFRKEFIIKQSINLKKRKNTFKVKGALIK